MAIPTIKLNLVPHRSFWQTYHFFIGWITLSLGSLVLIFVVVSTLRLYGETFRHRKQLSDFSHRNIDSSVVEVGDINELQNLDVTSALPIWQLAERIYTERNVTWSKLTEELERSLVQNVRINSILRGSFSDRGIRIEIVGEARSREAEASFMKSLKNNKLFEQMVFQKESERQGGGVLFTCVMKIS